MIIDDDKSIVELLEAMLSIQGYDVAYSYRSREAMARVREEQPDLILLDLMMPEVDGWQVLASLRDDRKLKDIPVIMVTALADTKKMVRDPARYGLAGLIIKPFDFDSLTATVREVLPILITQPV